MRGKRGKYKPTVAKLQRTCKTCGVLFFAKTKRKMFCSKLCIWRFGGPRKRTRKGQVVCCLYCGDTFYACPSRLRKGARQFCCRKHLFAFKKENARTFSCVSCGQAVIWGRKSCSPECLKKYQLEAVLERRKTMTQHQIDRAERYSKKTDDWRWSVFERDDYTCQFCFQRGGYLEADHIRPWAFFPELRHELSNGRTLCRACHNTTKVPAKTLRERWAK